MRRINGAWRLTSQGIRPSTQDRDPPCVSNVVKCLDYSKMPASLDKKGDRTLADFIPTTLWNSFLPCIRDAATLPSWHPTTRHSHPVLRGEALPQPKDAPETDTCILTTILMVIMAPPSPPPRSEVPGCSPTGPSPEFD